jgi:hypothetical protein
VAAIEVEQVTRVFEPRRKKAQRVVALHSVPIPTSGARVLGHDVVSDTKGVRPLIGIVFGGARGLYWRLWPVDRTSSTGGALLAIRGVFNRAVGGSILRNVALEAAVAAGWMTLALLSFNQLAERGRLDGTLDFGA